MIKIFQVNHNLRGLLSSGLQLEEQAVLPQTKLSLCLWLKHAARNYRKNDNNVLKSETRFNNLNPLLSAQNSRKGSTLSQKSKCEKAINIEFM